MFKYWDLYNPLHIFTILYTVSNCEIIIFIFKLSPTHLTNLLWFLCRLSLHLNIGVAVTSEGKKNKQKHDVTLLFIVCNFARGLEVGRSPHR